MLVRAKLLNWQVPLLCVQSSSFVSEGTDPSTLSWHSFSAVWWKFQLFALQTPALQTAWISYWVFCCFLDIIPLLGLNSLCCCCIPAVPNLFLNSRNFEVPHKFQCITQFDGFSLGTGCLGTRVNSNAVNPICWKLPQHGKYESPLIGKTCERTYNFQYMDQGICELKHFMIFILSWTMIRKQLRVLMCLSLAYF